MPILNFLPLVSKYFDLFLLYIILAQATAALNNSGHLSLLRVRARLRGGYRVRVRARVRDRV